WEALARGDIDVYADYTGTLAQVIVPTLISAPVRNPSPRALRAVLEPHGFGLSDPLGFNNSYGLGMAEAEASRRNIQNISDLANHPNLKFAVSDEFRGRPLDGWDGLVKRYEWKDPNVSVNTHEAALQALVTGPAGNRPDVTDVYTTDAEIAKYNLRVLIDDQHYFPRYDAVLVYRADLASRAPKV